MTTSVDVFLYTATVPGYAANAVLLRIPRHACTPRDTCRAGDLWRLVQEVAVRDSTDRGWPPSRYRAAGTGFVVRTLTGVHLREAHYDEHLDAETWVTDLRRGVLLRRETTFRGVLHASVEWVHIGPNGGIARAPTTLQAAFAATVDAGPGARLPAFAEADPLPLPPFRLTPWWTEMDPLGHTNHPRYVDWFDEAISRWLAARGHDPIGMVPVAERVRYLAAARAGDDLVVEGARVGHTDGAAVFHLRIRRAAAGDSSAETICEATLMRGHRDAPEGYG